jgi:hypothetical protein
MTLEIAQAINAVSNKVNDCMQRVDEYATIIHQQSTNSIDTSDEGLTEIAELVANLLDRVTALEGKVGM